MNMKNVKFLKCIKCGKTYPAIPDATTCLCGGILDVVYDYEYIKTKLNRSVLQNRTDRTMWRYRELLPIEEELPRDCGLVTRRCMNQKGSQKI